jgi:hypothetical protein
MKKTYIVPATIIVAVDDDATILSVSTSGVQSENRNIGYGGVDEDGSMTPASRKKDAWDDGEF